MDVLSQARAELMRLEEKVDELVRQLLDTRQTVYAQRIKVDGLIRQRPAAIQRLPTESLLMILTLDIQSEDRRGIARKQELASVSRRWRDVILDTPALWSSIRLLQLDGSSLKTHLRRSRESCLDIIIEEADYRPESNLFQCLDIAMSCAHRWRSLHVMDHDLVSAAVADSIHHLNFPALENVTIQLPTYPKFLTPTHAPTLAYLKLGGYAVSEDFLAPTTLKTLHLALDPDYDDPGAFYDFPHFIPSQTLTTLSLTGGTDHWRLQPNSVHFPHLRSLSLFVSKAKQFLCAIVTPNLERFEMCPLLRDGFPAVVFCDLRAKFKNVRSFTCPFTSAMEERFDGDYSGIEGFLHAFPGDKLAEYSLLYENLKEYCVLELDDVEIAPRMNVSTGADSPLKL
ncbi:hypothetical protein ID866_6949, partial [Astraeus odoratus]